MMASSYYTHNGGGANYICMHPTPTFPSGYSNGSQQGNLLYGVEYENQGSSAGNRNSNQDAACVVCQHNSLTQFYIQWGRKTCTNGHSTEYSGLIMSTFYTQQKSDNIYRKKRS